MSTYALLAAFKLNINTNTTHNTYKLSAPKALRFVAL